MNRLKILVSIFVLSMASLISLFLLPYSYECEVFGFFILCLVVIGSIAIFRFFDEIVKDHIGNMEASYQLQIDQLEQNFAERIRVTEDTFEETYRHVYEANLSLQQRCKIDKDSIGDICFLCSGTGFKTKPQILEGECNRFSAIAELQSL